MIEIRPISISEANRYVELNHRHHGKRVGCKFAIGCFHVGGGICGVAMCANPVARNSDDGETLEVARVCTDGTRNACSMLYGACARIAKEMGYRKIQTYILNHEQGTSLKASGWICEAENVGAYSWTENTSERQKKRNEMKQMSFIEEKKPPRELKKRYVRYFYRKDGDLNGPEC